MDEEKEVTDPGQWLIKARITGPGRELGSARPILEKNLRFADRVGETMTQQDSDTTTTTVTPIVTATVLASTG